MSDHLAALEEYRGIREAIETSIIPMATSVDGRRFEYQASLHELELEAGGYVAIESHGETWLGQVLSLRMEQHLRYLRCRNPQGASAAFGKRTTGLEPATFGLGSRRSTN